MKFASALCAGLFLLTSTACAGTVDNIQKEIFDDSGTKIKVGYRFCSGDRDCTAILSLCRWRAVNKNSARQVGEVSNRAKLECKWPKPPERAPIPRCIEKLCDIPPDGRYY